MSRNDDQISRLEGESQLPPLTPPAKASGMKPMIAGIAIIVSIVAVLGVVAVRQFTSSEPKAPPKQPDVASATAAKLRVEPPPPVAAPTPAASAVAQAIAAQSATSVPSIEPAANARADAIPLVGGNSTSAPKRAVRAGDESPFAVGPVSQPNGAAQGQAVGAPPGSLAAQAQANLKRYEEQLGGMMAQLQGLADDQSKPKASPTQLATAAAAPATQAATTPPLFGSMERSATPMVSASTLGNRSLTMPKGVLFTCSLKTKVISASSGFVGCQLMRNVFSDDGKVVLAERGSHLDGEYRVVQVRPGMTRIPVLWTRLRTPHGITVDLDSPGTGQLGESGIGGYVDNRWPERIGAALLVSLIDDAVKLAASDDNGSGNATVILPGTSQNASKLAEKVLESTINIPPLIYQNQGSVVGVYVARDIDFSKVYGLEPR